MPATNGPKRGARRGDLSSVAVEATTALEPDVSIREVRARIEEVFLALGTDKLPGTLVPTGHKNNSAEAAEYVLSDLLEKLATERKKKAFEAAEKAGVFGDPSDYVAGDTVMVFNDHNFSINVKLGRPSTMLGRELVEAAASKYLGRKAEEFLSECKKERSATKQIIVSMK